MAISLFEEYSEILSYWFGGSLKENYHQRWFPAANSHQQNTADEFVRQHFRELLARAENGELDDTWTREPLGVLALIITLDQLSRHVHRHDRGQIEVNDRKALELSLMVLDRGWDIHYGIPQKIFALMPLRHTPTVERLKLVADRINVMQASILPEEGELIHRFRRTTIRRLEGLEGRPQAKDLQGYEILEFHPFDVDDTDMPKEKLYRATERFLRARSQSTSSDVPGQHPLVTVAVSLSGGVDSMVIAKILVKIRAMRTFPQFQRIVAMHVDYASRAESGMEADYVEEWCQKHDIIFRKRTISEVTRGVTKRDDYEAISRDIRYNLYKEMQREYSFSAVIFGHHKGDVQENVISNFMKGMSLLSLSGMGEESYVNGVLIWRPFLHHVKQDIFDFAHKYGVPYFKDTTPKWSNRGKMRDHLLPLLQQMYGDGTLQNLNALSEESLQMNEVFTEVVLRPLWRQVIETPTSCWLECKDFVHSPLLLWKEGLRHICHSLLGIGMVREKPLQEFLMKLRGQNTKRGGAYYGWISLRKENRAYLEGTKLIIFRPEVFPPDGSLYAPLGLELSLDCSPYHFGPWIVSLNLHSDEEKKQEDELGQQLNLWDIVKGSLTYDLPHTPSYQIFPRNRPFALKLFEKGITDILPIVAPKGEFDDDTRKNRVQVTLTFDREWYTKKTTEEG